MNVLVTLVIMVVDVLTLMDITDVHVPQDILVFVVNLVRKFVLLFRYVAVCTKNSHSTLDFPNTIPLLLSKYQFPLSIQLLLFTFPSLLCITQLSIRYLTI